MSELKAIYSQVLQRWQELSKREQYLLSTIGILLLLFFVINGIFRPVIESNSRALQNLENQRQLHAEVVAGANRIRTLQAQGATISLSGVGRPLDERIRLAAQKSGITVHRLNMQQDSVQVTLADLPFTTLMQWLGSLEQQSIQTHSLQIEQGDQPGVVSVNQLRLVGSGAES